MRNFFSEMACLDLARYISLFLFRFAKNLDPSSLSLKFFKGEGELTNLELDEVMLSDLLEFPPWLQLTKVTCNRISAKVRYHTCYLFYLFRLVSTCVEELWLAVSF